MSGDAGRRKRHHEEEHENSERWLVTYADMLTVLMALFIVMFALSVVDKKKFEEFKNGLNDKPGAGESMLVGGDGLLAVKSSEMAVEVDAEALAALEEKTAQLAAKDREQDQLEAARAKIAATLAQKGMTGSVRFRIDERGLVVTVVTDDVLFELGSATLRPAGTKVLDAIAPALTSLPNPVTVEGHTDDVPISGRYGSNWELSTERATSVLRYVLTRQVPANRMSAAGYADQRPVASNGTPAGRSANRRVEVIVRATAQRAAVQASPAKASPAKAGPAKPKPPGTAAAPVTTPAKAEPADHPTDEHAETEEQH